jgi:transcriptional regulator with XRE-family HTH domain
MTERDVVIGFAELRHWMRARKMTLRAFAELSDVDKNTIWRLLNGHRHTVSLTDADRIVKATDGGVSLDEIRAFEIRMQAWRAAMRA